MAVSGKIENEYILAGVITEIVSVWASPDAQDYSWVYFSIVEKWATAGTHYCGRWNSG